MIRLEKVSKGFGDRVLFSNLSMTFESGKVYALIGSSGSGKTTLMNMLAALEDYQGEIFFRGKNLKIYKSSDFSATNWATCSSILGCWRVRRLLII